MKTNSSARVKISQLVNVQNACSQLLISWNKLLSSFNEIGEANRLATSCSSIKLVSTCYEQPVQQLQQLGASSAKRKVGYWSPKVGGQGFHAPQHLKSIFSSVATSCNADISNVKNVRSYTIHKIKIIEIFFHSFLQNFDCFRTYTNQDEEGFI